MFIPEEYSVDAFLKRAEGMSWADLVAESHRLFRSLQNLRLTPRHHLYPYKSRIDYYIEFLGEFCFLISQLHRPAGMSEEQFKLTRPVLESLVEKNQLEQTVLNIYK
jgi:hypothetical protein